MAWTSPKTWTSEVLTSTDMNTYMRDNQSHLYTRIGNNDVRKIDTTNYATASGTYGSLSGVSGTITTNGGNVLVGFHGAIENSNAKRTYFDIDVDGTPWGGDDGLLVVEDESATPQIFNVSFVTIVTGLSAASHTFQLRWKVETAGTTTLFAGSGVDPDVHPSFWVQEL